MAFDNRLSKRFPAASLAVMLREYRSTIETFGQHLPEERRDEVVKAARRKSYHVPFESVDDLLTREMKGIQVILGQNSQGNVLIYDDKVLGEFGHYSWGMTAYLSQERVDGTILVRNADTLPLIMSHYEGIRMSGLRAHLRKLMDEQQIAVCEAVVHAQIPFSSVSKQYFSKEGKLLRDSPLQAGLTIVIAAHKARALCKSDKAGREMIRLVHEGKSFSEAYALIEPRYRAGP